MAEEKFNELNKKLDNAVSDIYDYIKIVDQKTEQNDKTLKFIAGLQSEQMKELIQTKSNDLRNFFEDAIRMQTEVVRNAYEKIISDLKLTYEQDLKNKDIENLKIYNQKLETLKSSYENQITNLRESMETDCVKRLNESYSTAKNEFDKLMFETVQRYEAEKNELIEKHKRITQETADKVYLDAKNEFEKIIKSTSDEVYNKTKDDYEKLMATKCEEAYNKGKADTEEWSKGVVKQNLDILGTEYEEKIAKLREEQAAEIKKITEQKDAETEQKLEEIKAFYEKEILQKSEEAYNNGKADTEAWSKDILKQNLDIQGTEYQVKMEDLRQKNLTETEALKNSYEEIMAQKCEEAYNKGKADTEEWGKDVLKQNLDILGTEYEEKIAKLREEQAEEIKKLIEQKDAETEQKIKETKAFYEEEMLHKTEEAYNKGKADTEEWHDKVVKQKLEIQANYFEGEIERAKKETKAEMYDEMDEAARRNEAELKLFLDFYEAKMKPFKKLINIHETTDTRIKDIQRRIKNKVYKTIGQPDKVVPYGSTKTIGEINEEKQRKGGTND